MYSDRTYTWSLGYEVVAKCSRLKARAGRLTFDKSAQNRPNLIVDTPVFMPVGTQGTVKGVTPEQLVDMDIQIILGNTFHLGSKPGDQIIADMPDGNKLKSFMNWNRAILSDSGGFQIVSLSKLRSVSEEGVRFKHPNDENLEIMLTPEKSMEIQRNLGSDIIMQLDDVVSSTTQEFKLVNDAMLRSIRWLDRALNTFKYTTNNEARVVNENNLFGIVQGGLDNLLRAASLKMVMDRPVPGYAIGGLSGGEAKTDFFRTVDFCTDELHENKPRYLMGVGFAIDLVLCTALGCDMYDCVYPTRTARFGTALTRNEENLNVKALRYKKDYGRIDEDCWCYTCRNYTRSQICRQFQVNAVAAQNLLSLHNLAFQKRLMNELRQSIIDDKLEDYVVNFVVEYYKNKEIPDFVKLVAKNIGVLDLL